MNFERCVIVNDAVSKVAYLPTNFGRLMKGDMYCAFIDIVKIAGLIAVFHMIQHKAKLKQRSDSLIFQSFDCDYCESKQNDCS